MNFLDDFIDFIGSAWNEFVSFVGDIIDKIIQSISDWISSILSSIETDDIIITTGPESVHLPEDRLQDEFEKHGIELESMSDRQQAQLLQKIAFKAAKKKDKHTVSLTQEEEERWEETTENKAKVYRVTSI